MTVNFRVASPLIHSGGSKCGVFCFVFFPPLFLIPQNLKTQNIHRKFPLLNTTFNATFLEIHYCFKRFEAFSLKTRDSFPFFDFVRASRGQLSSTDLPSGWSQGFNQCTEDLVEKRGEKFRLITPHMSAVHMVLVTQESPEASTFSLICQQQAADSLLTPLF